MRRELVAGLIACALMTAHGGQTFAAPVTLRWAIDKPADCDKIHDYPYARELFCAASFAAAQTMVAEVAKTLGVKAPSGGFFHYFQTLPDPAAPDDELAQTTIPCLDTPAPYPSGSAFVKGAGVPLCHLVAYVTSPGPNGQKERKNDPVPKVLRDYPDYFSRLYSPEKKNDLKKFRTGSAFDKIIIGLGAAGADGFNQDYKKFTLTTFYDPDKWTKDSRYAGISGGGGGGWGGEVAVLGTQGPIVLLAFGGGGGGGMTSYRPGPTTPATSKLGAGGGGGMQFANGYQSKGKSYNGLGLGAGTGSGESAVQYSYSDYAGSGRPPQPADQFNPGVIADYDAQMKNLADQLKANYQGGKTVVVRGGGGMGAGTEYLRSNGDEFVPNALSTQGGFQFNYEFLRKRTQASDAAEAALDHLNTQQEDIYAFIGEAYLAAGKVAFDACGRDYSNYACMCPREHAEVICLVTEHVGGDPALLPAWLQQRHCPGDAPTSGLNGNTLSGYQQMLLNSSPPSCTSALTNYFTRQNTAAGNP